jgi:transposase
MTVETIAKLPLFSFGEKQAQAESHKYSDVLKLLQSGYSIRYALKRLEIPRSNFYNHMAKDEQLRALVNEMAPRYHPGKLKVEPQLTGPYNLSLQQQISLLLKRLSQGHTFRKACKDAGLSDTVVYRWKRENKDFADQINAVHQFDSSGARKVHADEATASNRVNVGLKGHYHLYIIKAKGCDLVKVGSSKVPSRRLVALQTGSPLVLSIDRYIVGAAIFEKDIHLDLTTRGLHSHGEWFHESCIPFVMDYIHRHVKQLA